LLASSAGDSGAVLIRLKHDKASRLMVVLVSADPLQVSRLMLDTPAASLARPELDKLTKLAQHA